MLHCKYMSLIGVASTFEDFYNLSLAGNLQNLPLPTRRKWIERHGDGRGTVAERFRGFVG